MGPAPDTKAAAAGQPPGAAHYDTSYLGASLERFHSYHAQVVEAMQPRPSTILLVGKGDGIVSDILARGGVRVTTLDVVQELKPDILGSVEAIPAADASFDVSMCCQVLEHLPFERFGVALRELRRVTKKRLVLSVPDVRRFASFRIRVPGIRCRFQFSLPGLPEAGPPAGGVNQHGHYWEIGFNGTSYGRVRAEIEAAGWSRVRHFRVCDLPWHSFFILDIGSTGTR